MKKLIFTFLLLCFSLPVLLAQSDVGDLFMASFDVDLPTAKTYRKQIIEKAPNSKYALYCKGWFKTKNDSVQAALAIAVDLTTKYPDFVYGFLLKGNCYYYMEDYFNAIQVYNKVIEMDAKENGGFHNRGLCKFFLEDYRGALLDYNKAIEVNPNFPETYYRRGIVKIKLGQKDEGCLDLSKAGEMGYRDAYEEIKKLCN